MTTRRTFLTMLAAIPVVGQLRPKRKPSPKPKPKTFSCWVRTVENPGVAMIDCHVLGADGKWHKFEGATMNIGDTLYVRGIGP